MSNTMLLVVLATLFVSSAFARHSRPEDLAARINVKIADGDMRRLSEERRHRVSQHLRSVINIMEYRGEVPPPRREFEQVICRHGRDGRSGLFRERDGRQVGVWLEGRDWCRSMLRAAKRHSVCAPIGYHYYAIFDVRNLQQKTNAREGYHWCLRELARYP